MRQRGPGSASHSPRARVARVSARAAARIDPRPDTEEIVREIERLRNERSSDADQVASMLVRLAQTERALADVTAARDGA